MDRDALLDRIVARDRAIAALQAEQFADVVAFSGSNPVVDELLARSAVTGEERVIGITDASREELACALRIPAMTAHHLIHTGRLLAGPLLGTREALAAGEITLAHVRVIAEAAERLDSDPVRCAALEARVLPVAKRGTPARARACARRAVLAIDPDGQARRRAAAKCTRDVYLMDDLDGISTLIARLSTVQARAVLAAVDSRAGQCEGEVVGERRANALVGLVLGDPDLPGSQNVLGAVTVNLDVVVTLPTMLGLGDEPAALAGTGAIAFDELRELLNDPAVGVTLRRLVTDPLTGHLLDRGRTAYVVPNALRAFITTRDRHCRFPGCRRKAILCQIDHADPYQDGGTTDRCNLGPLCQRHHNLKTHGGWTIIISAEDGSCTWRSPEGRHYPHHPPPLLE